jgi:hypothetical protein
MLRLFEREASFATSLTHPHIVRFHGAAQLHDSPVLIYDRYKYSLDEAIAACRRPSKDKRIAMAIHLLDAVAWMHALNVAHTALSMQHVLVRVSYPWIIRVPYAEECFVSNLAYSAKPMTRHDARQDMLALTHLICCIMYWERIQTPDPDWLDTFHSKHAKSRKFMRAVQAHDSYASAVDWARDCKRSVE